MSQERLPNKLYFAKVNTKKAVRRLRTTWLDYNENFDWNDLGFEQFQPRFCPNLDIRSRERQSVKADR